MSGVTALEVKSLTQRLQETQSFGPIKGEAPATDGHRIGYGCGRIWALQEATWLELQEVAGWASSDDNYLYHLVMIGNTFYGTNAPRGFSIGFIEAVGEVGAAFVAQK